MGRLLSLITSSARVRWWDSSATTYRTAAWIPAEIALTLPDLEIPEQDHVGYTSNIPVIFGHYWCRGTPVLQAPRVACVDYSAALKGQALVAYRWDGESILDSKKFVGAQS